MFYIYNKRIITTLEYSEDFLQTSCLRRPVMENNEQNYATSWKAFTKAKKLHFIPFKS